MRISFKSVMAVALVLAAAGMGAGVHAAPGPDAKAGAPAKPAAPVRVGTVERRDVPVMVKAVGNVEPYAKVEIKSQVAGKVQEIHFSEGQMLSKGDLLFTIDSAPYVARVNEIKANMERDRVEARNARRQAERYGNLRQTGAVTEVEYDKYLTDAQSLEASVVAQEAALASAQLSIDYCTITAPMDGRAGEVLIDPGNIVGANDSDAMVVLFRTHPVYVSFAVPEQYLPDVRPVQGRADLAVMVTGAGFDNDPQSGKVTFVDSEVDRTAGTIRLKATAPNDKDLLWPGQFVDVALTLRMRTGALVVPQAAVQTGQQGQYVYVLKDDGTVEPRPLVVIDRIGRDAVVESKLEPGERVVTDGHLRLTPGAKAEVVTEVVQAAPKS